MSLLTDQTAPHHLAPQPEPGGRAAGRRSARSRRRKRSTPLSGRYIGYVLYFVGAGLISGAVVHHPLDPARYTVVAIIGVFVFLVATLVNEFMLAQERPRFARALVVIGASLLLSFGIGMLSGGLQHFEDFPARGAVLVPLGIVVSFVAFVLKDAETPSRRIFSPLGLVVLLVAGGSYFGLSTLAAGMGSESSEGGGHSHGGGEPETDEHDTEPEPSTSADKSAEPSAAPTSADPEHADEGTDDGHAH
ncbi:MULTISPECIES: hypothetical protein [Streptomyces]|uniref:Uncharacterized protein n=1 Tax=Streptomyces venezuelae TaxID=54571 RepID=A0A5P2ALP5_STRVZ|nr:hypothetical protein [Streptomyces venezuelae]QES18757.1 hypothetical protein DEJ46_06370 [Streptomyces venezuelae]